MNNDRHPNNPSDSAVCFDPSLVEELAVELYGRLCWPGVIPINTTARNPIQRMPTINATSLSDTIWQRYAASDAIGRWSPSGAAWPLIQRAPDESVPAQPSHHDVGQSHSLHVTNTPATTLADSSRAELSVRPASSPISALASDRSAKPATERDLPPVVSPTVEPQPPIGPARPLIQRVLDESVATQPSHHDFGQSHWPHVTNAPATTLTDSSRAELSVRPASAPPSAPIAALASGRSAKLATERDLPPAVSPSVEPLGTAWPLIRRAPEAHPTLRQLSARSDVSVPTPEPSRPEKPDTVERRQQLLKSHLNQPLVRALSPTVTSPNPIGRVPRDSIRRTQVVPAAMPLIERVLRHLPRAAYGQPVPITESSTVARPIVRQQATSSRLSVEQQRLPLVRPTVPETLRDVASASQPRQPQSVPTARRIDASASPPSESLPGDSGRPSDSPQTPKIDTLRLAEQVYQILLRRLETERERRGL